MGKAAIKKPEKPPCTCDCKCTGHCSPSIAFVAAVAEHRQVQGKVREWLSHMLPGWRIWDIDEDDKEIFIAHTDIGSGGNAAGNFSCEDMMKVQAKFGTAVTVSGGTTAEDVSIPLLRMKL